VIARAERRAAPRSTFHPSTSSGFLPIASAMVSLLPLRHLAFRRLATSYTLNELGWGFGTVALGLLVFDQTHSALATTALWLCTLLVPAVVGPAATAKLDGAATRRVLPALYLAEAVIFAMLALLARSTPWLAVVLVLAALDGTVALVGRALTRSAVVATLKPHDQLEAGNALLNMAFSLCFAIGPALGGLVVARDGVSAALWVSAGIFVAMTATLASSGSLPPAHTPAEDSWLARLRAGLGHVRANGPVRRVLAAHAAIFICAAMISPIEVIWAREVVGGGKGAYGVVLSAWGVGTLATGLVLVSLWRRAPILARLPLAAGTMAIGYVVMALATSLPAAVAGCFIGGAGNGFYYVSVIQAIQERVADEFQGRVMGLLESTTAGCFGLGFLMAAALTELTSVRVTFAATAIGVILATAWMAALLRHGDEEPSGRSAASDGFDELDEAHLELEHPPIGVATGDLGGERPRPDIEAL
jgi:predicted MFS family arabinose efflux permease